LIVQPGQISQKQTVGFHYTITVTGAINFVDPWGMFFETLPWSLLTHRRAERRAFFY